MNADQRDVSALAEVWVTEHNRQLGGDMTFKEMQISREGFAAGFKVGIEPPPSDAAPFVCDICGARGIIGTRKRDGSMEIRCAEHFPEVPPEH